MSLRNALKTNKNLEKDGVALQIANTRVTLARAGGSNQAYNAKLTVWYKSNKRAIELDSLPETVLRGQFIDFYADAVVINWETDINYVEGEERPAEWVVGIETDGKDADGKTVIKPFNRDNVVEYFKEVPDWFLECKLFAEKAQNYRQSLLDGISGN